MGGDSISTKNTDTKKNIRIKKFNYWLSERIFLKTPYLFLIFSALKRKQIQL